MFNNPYPKIISFSCMSFNNKGYNNNVFQEEIKISQSFSGLRKNQFLAGRTCAHNALSFFGSDDTAILRDLKTREPIWPRGFCGTITHHNSYAAAAVAKSKNIFGVGIDLENLTRRIDFSVFKYICTKNERNCLINCDKESADRKLKILFSAKESIFKAYFPLTKINLKFQEAEIKLSKDYMHFDYIIFNKDEKLLRLGVSGSGKIKFNKDLVLTSLIIRKHI